MFLVNSVTPPFRSTRLFASVSLLAIAFFVAPSFSARAEADATADVFESAQVDRPPQPRREIHIRYPRELRKERAEVKLRFIVRATGKVESLTVVKFSNVDMIELAYRGYEDADYSPGLKNGKPVDTWVEVTEVAK